MGADSKKAWSGWQTLFKSQNKLAFVLMDMKIAKIHAERALAKSKTGVNQKAVDAATEKSNKADSDLTTSVDNATKLLTAAIEKRDKAKRTSEHWLDVEFSETKALDHANDTNKVVAMVAGFEKSLGALGARNSKILAAARKSKDKLKLIAADAAIKANRKQHEKQSVALTNGIKKLMDQDATIKKKYEILKTKKRTATIEYQKEINKCRRVIMSTNVLKNTLAQQKKKLLGERVRRMLARRNLRMLQKLVKTQTAAGNKSKIDRNAVVALVKKMMEAEGKLLECGSTIKANTEIVRTRLETGREHVNVESDCTAWTTKTQRVIDSRMGNYKETMVKVQAIQKQIAAKSAALKKAGNKSWQNVGRQASMLDGYIFDTAYKAWTLDYQGSIVRGWQCSTD